MARAEVFGFEDLEKTLMRMAETDEIALRAVNSATPIIEQAMKSAIAANVKDGHALVASITPTSARKNRYGVFSVVRPVGVDKRGRRFGEILAYIEYGTKPRKHGKDGKTDDGLPAKHVRAQAKHMAEQRCHDIIERTLSEAFKQ